MINWCRNFLFMILILISVMSFTTLASMQNHKLIKAPNFDTIFSPKNKFTDFDSYQSLFVVLNNYCQKVDKNFNG